MNNNFILTTPNIDFKDTYVEGIKDFQKEGVRHTDVDINYLENNFEKEIKKESLTESGIPRTVYWLIVDSKYVGRVLITHYLDEKRLNKGGHIGYEVIPSERKKGYGTILLNEALVKAKELEIKKVLITCNEKNVGSLKIIERAGGVLENKVPVERRKFLTCRFWITL